MTAQDAINLFIEYHTWAETMQAIAEEMFNASNESEQTTRMLEARAAFVRILGRKPGGKEA